MQALPTPENSDASAATPQSNLLPGRSKKRSLNTFLEDTQNISASRELSQTPYAEAMPLNVIVPRGTHRALYPKPAASTKSATQQNGRHTLREQEASKETHQDQEEEQIRRLRMEHEALTHCLIETMSRKTLEELLANAALKYPAIMHSIIANNNPSSTNTQPEQPAETQKTFSGGRNTRREYRASTDLSTPQSERLPSPTAFTLRASLPPNHIGQSSKTPQTGDREIVYDPQIHGSTSNGWTVQDDQLLKASRDRGMTWPQIQAKYFPSRTHNQCRLRLARVLGVHTKGEERIPYTMVPWTPEEDARLLAARKSGMLWHRLQQTHFPNRTHYACSHRHRKLLRDKKLGDGVQAGVSSDEEDLDATEDDEETLAHDTVNARPTPWSSTEDEQLVNGRQSGMQFLTIQQRYFPHRSQQSVESRYCRLKRMKAAGSTRDPWGVKRHEKERQKRDGEHDDMTLDDLLDVSDQEDMELGGQKQEGDDMTLDDLLSPSEDEGDAEMVSEENPRNSKTPPKSIIAPKSTQAVERQPSHTPAPNKRVPLPTAPGETKRASKSVEIEESDKQDEEDEVPQGTHDVQMTDEDDELLDPESTITVHVPAGYDP